VTHQRLGGLTRRRDRRPDLRDPDAWGLKADSVPAGLELIDEITRLTLLDIVLER
jgi:hypothetical protein